MSEVSNKECFDAFIDEMRQVLKYHSQTKGNSWREMPEHELVENLMQEVHEFEIKNDPDHELVDIANSAYLLWAKRKFFKGA